MWRRFQLNSKEFLQAIITLTSIALIILCWTIKFRVGDGTDYRSGLVFEKKFFFLSLCDYMKIIILNLIICLEVNKYVYDEKLF